MATYAEVDSASGAVAQIVSYSESPDAETVGLLALSARALVVIDGATERRLQTRPHRRDGDRFVESDQ